MTDPIGEMTRPGRPEADRSHRAAWMRRAARLSRVVNTAALLRTALPALVILHAALAAGIVLTRRADLPALPLGIGYAVTLAVILLVAARRARPRMTTPADMLRRLETHHRMNSALSAAEAGYIPWPALPAEPTAAVRFDAAPWAIPALLIVALPLGALATPRPAIAAPTAAAPAAEPPEWTEMEAMLEKIAEADVAEEESVRRLRERLDELRRDNAADMFGHASREATESMRDELASDLNKLGSALGKTAELAASMEKLAAEGAPAPKALEAAWDKALADLAASPLAANRETLAQLAEISPEELAKLDPKKLGDLRKQLAEGACEACKAGGSDQNGQPGEQGKPGASDSPNGMAGANADAAAHLARLEAIAAGDFSQLPEPWKEQAGSGPGTGTGEVGRGRGDAALGLTHDAEKQKGVREKIPGATGGALPGERLATARREATGDDIPEFSRSTGGDTLHTGAGGEAVWRDRLTPEEVEFLSRYHDAPAAKPAPKAAPKSH